MNASAPTPPAGRRQHWEAVYASKPDGELSWYQEAPEQSLALIDALRPPPRRAIDVGGGQSALAGALLERGLDEVAVLDISAAAIERARHRLGPWADRVRWIVGDVLDPGVLAQHPPFDLWHDRAVFHFLVEPAERAAYAAVAAAHVVSGGHLVVATFAPSGPARCSGLAVQRHDASSLGREFAPAFRPLASELREHLTPWGKPQPFTWSLLRRE